MRSLTRKQGRVGLPLLAELGCGTCRACCTIMRVDELEKPAGVACQHLESAADKPGCKTYETRPQDCRTWDCVWRRPSSGMTPDQRPDRLGVLFDTPRPEPGKFQNAYLAYEVFAGGFERASGLIESFAKTSVVSLMKLPEKPGGDVTGRLIGPPELVRAFVEGY